MEKKEVGFPPGEGILQAERMYIVPLLQGERTNNIKIFILPDGNNRARLEGKKYTDSGGKVIEIAEALAQNRNDVALMVTCILSPENISKRSDEFFAEMYKAFVALGVNIKNSGTLVDSQIRLEVYGKLEHLRKREGFGRKLADMIEAVCGMTSHIKKPKLRLLLGVDYDENTALDLDVNVMFRSGMEGPDTARSSGIRMHNNIPFYGVETLWPNVNYKEIADIIEDTKSRMNRTLSMGYTPEFIVGLIKSQAAYNGREWGGGYHATINTTASKEKMMEALESIMPIYGGPYIELVGADGKFVHKYNANGSQKNTLRIILDSAIFHRDDDPYDAFIVPGQRGQKFFTLPAEPKIKYATAHKCDSTPEGIIQGVQRALKFAEENTALQGAERKIDEIKNPATEQIEKPDVSYEMAAKVFVEKLEKWALTLNVPQEKETQKRAFINYLLTAFFIAYDYRNPDWEKLKQKWEERGELLAKYKTAIYTGDEDIFDYFSQKENENTRRKRLEASAAFLKKIINGTNINKKIVPKVEKKETLIAIAGLWHKIIEYYKNISHPRVLDGWKEALVDLYDSSVKEYDESSTCNPILAEVIRSSGNNIAAQQKLLERYINRAPIEIGKKMEQLLEAITIGQDENLKEKSAKELQLLMYLLDVNNSIGAGLVYRTAALTVPSCEITDEMIKALNDICTISNCCYRLANDIAGRIKSFNSDGDQKKDAFWIMVKKMETKQKTAEAEIHGLAELIKIMKGLQTSYFKCLRRLFNVWPYIGDVVQRGGIGFKVYNQAHYKDLTVDQMFKIMRDYEEELYQQN